MPPIRKCKENLSIRCCKKKKCIIKRLLIYLN
jgi:hypothetical protein